MPSLTVKLNTGYDMPVLGIGTWKSKEGEVFEAVVKALETGYKHVDCAAIYGNEKEVGRALQQCTSDGVIKREELFVTSKLWNSKHAPEDVEAACRKTLSDLQLDYLDLYLIHWPISYASSDGKMARQVPIEDTWAAMEKLVDAGLVRSIGISNFSVKKTEALLKHATKPIASNQVEAHPYWRNDKIVDYCKSKGIVITSYSPLGTNDSAFLRKKLLPKVLEDEVVTNIAAKIGKSAAQVLIRWAIQRGTIVIPKSVNPGRIEQNYDVLDWEIPAEDFDKLCKLEFQHRYLLGDFFVGESLPLKSVDELWDGE